MRYRKPSYPYQPELTLKTNLVQRVLRKLRQPNIFCKFAKTSFEHCQPVFVCVLLAIGMATVQPRRMAVNGGALRFANQLRSSSLQIGGGQDEAAVSTRPTTSKQPPQPPTHTLQLCSVVILREKPQFSRGCSVSCR